MQGACLVCIWPALSFAWYFSSASVGPGVAPMQGVSLVCIWPALRLHYTLKHGPHFKVRSRRVVASSSLAG